MKISLHPGKLLKLTLNLVEDPMSDLSVIDLIPLSEEENHGLFMFKRKSIAVEIHFGMFADAKIIASGWMSGKYLTAIEHHQEQIHWRVSTNL